MEPPSAVSGRLTKGASNVSVCVVVFCRDRFVGMHANDRSVVQRPHGRGAQYREMQPIDGRLLANGIAGVWGAVLDYRQRTPYGRCSGRCDTRTSPLVHNGLPMRPFGRENADNRLQGRQSLSVVVNNAAAGSLEFAPPTRCESKRADGTVQSVRWR